MNPYLFRRIRGPVLLVCVGIAALLAQWHVLAWDQSWPIYLIALGLLSLVESAAWLTGAAAAAQLWGNPGARRTYVPRRRPFTGGVVLLLVGVYALLVTTGVLGGYFAWQALAVWWPLLLILVGLLLLVERLVDRSYARRTGGVYVGRARLGGGLGFLIVLLVLLGLTANGTIGGGNWGGWNRWSGFGNNGGNWGWSWGGQQYTNTVSLSEAIPADAVVTVQNAHGDLELGPSSDGQIHVEATQQANVSEHGKHAAFAATRPQLTVSGSSVLLNVPARDDVTVSLAVSVPPAVLCTLHNHHGAIDVSGLTRPLAIDQDHGDVTLDSLGGSVRLTMDHGDVHARALTGDLIVDGTAGDITASGIAGRTQLHGSFFGATTLDQVSGPVDFDSNRTQLHAQHLAGDLSIDGSDLSVSGASGGFTLNTRSKDVEVTGLSGDAQITDSNDDLTVSLARPLGAVSLRDNTGDVALSMPDGASFQLSGSNGADDDFASDFAVDQSTHGDTRSFHGQSGQGGPAVTIEVEHGDVSVRRVPAEAAVPAVPAVPAIPAVPAPLHPPRRLHTDGETPQTAPA